MYKKKCESRRPDLQLRKEYKQGYDGGPARRSELRLERTRIIFPVGFQKSDTTRTSRIVNTVILLLTLCDD